MYCVGDAWNQEPSVQIEKLRFENVYGSSKAFCRLPSGPGGWLLKYDLGRDVPLRFEK